MLVVEACHTLADPSLSAIWSPSLCLYQIQTWYQAIFCVTVLCCSDRDVYEMVLIHSGHMTKNRNHLVISFCIMSRWTDSLGWNVIDNNNSSNTTKINCVVSRTGRTEYQLIAALVPIHSVLAFLADMYCCFFWRRPLIEVKTSI